MSKTQSFSLRAQKPSETNVHTDHYTSKIYFDKDLESAYIVYGIAKWESLKPSPVVRMCGGRQPMEGAMLSCLHHVISISRSDVISENYPSLQGGPVFSPVPSL